MFYELDDGFELLQAVLIVFVLRLEALGQFLVFGVHDVAVEGQTVDVPPKYIGVLFGFGLTFPVVRHMCRCSHFEQ